MTMTLVSTVTVGAGGAASIDFTSIPQTGTDLLVVLSTRITEPEIQWPITIEFNGSGGTSYSSRWLNGTGSGVQSGSTSSAAKANIGTSSARDSTSNTFGNTTTYIANYSSTSAAKSISSDSVGENNATEARQYLNAGLWNSTSAISSLKVFPISGTWSQYSIASLYTITKGSGGATVS